MADTRGWSLQDFAAAAGKRTEPYPTCAVETIAQDHRCAACGGDLTGRTAKTTGLPLVFCSNVCRNTANRRWRSRPDESAAVGFSSYTW